MSVKQLEERNRALRDHVNQLEAMIQMQNVSNSMSGGEDEYSSHMS